MRTLSFLNASLKSCHYTSNVKPNSKPSYKYNC